MKRQLQALAYDIGASSGRGLAVMFDGATMHAREVHRFPNRPVTLGGSIHWNVLSLYRELLNGMLRCSALGIRPDSLAIDTWGVDFGLLSKSGELLGNPFHYRTPHNDGMMEKVAAAIPTAQLFEHTGIQPASYNTINQIMAYRLYRPEWLEHADSLLLMPDLLNYFLTGVRSTERTIASTTQMLQIDRPAWLESCFAALGAPRRLFTSLHEPGTRLGVLGGEARAETGWDALPVAAVAAHDTASAVAAIPAREHKFVFISCGTWSLLGTETDRPTVADPVFRHGFSNERGFGGKIRLLKNLSGLWLLQECKRHWENEAGSPIAYDRLEVEAGKAEAFRCFIDPDDDGFMKPGDMPRRIAEFCRRTGQLQPRSRGEYARCIFESLAMKIRRTVDRLEDLIGYRLGVVHIVGGGSLSAMLCQFIADSTGKETVAGPAEAAAIGNGMVQMHALGEIGGLSEIRAVMGRSLKVDLYRPGRRAEWKDAFADFMKVTDAVPREEEEHGATTQPGES